MKVTKLLPRLSLSITFALSVFAFLSQSTGTLLADGAVAPQSFRTGSVSATSPKITIALLEPIREVWIYDEGFAASRLSMMRIMARRTKAATVMA